MNMIHFLSHAICSEAFFLRTTIHSTVSAYQRRTGKKHHVAGNNLQVMSETILVKISAHQRDSVTKRPKKAYLPIKSERNVQIRLAHQAHLSLLFYRALSLEHLYRVTDRRFLQTLI